jgi:hypothetical protein
LTAEKSPNQKELESIEENNMLILMVLCFGFAIVCALLKAFNVPNPPPTRPHLGWLGFVFLVLAFMIEYVGKR